MDQNNGNGNTEKNSEGTEITNMASLLAQEGLSLNLPKSGEIKTGTIASISPGQIMVSIGAKSEGIIRGQEFELIPPDIFASLEVGQEIPVFIVIPEDHHGNLILSYVRALESESWEKARNLMKEKGTFTGTIEGFNRGGLLVNFNELHGFIPSSQLSFSRRADMANDTPEKRYSNLIGQEITLQVIEVDQERRRLIFSERAAVHESRDSIRDKVIDKLNIGDILTGRITSLADFGAFVNIKGADGLVHLSEISWDRIRHPGDELKVGQEIQVKVISIDEEKRHIGLSIRQLKEDPWQQQIKDLRVGQLVEAKITRLTKFGAFARLTNEIEGLIHISEISDEHIGHPKEVLHEGDDVTLRIIKIEQESHRIGLSLRRVESLAFADMDMKTLEKELTDTDIKVTADDAPSKEIPESDVQDTASGEDESVSKQDTEKAPEENTTGPDADSTEPQQLQEETSDEPPSGGTEEEKAEE
ncbi:MAG: S1 RNA-binding domain-containing protein [Anaerolineaceae bacterium]|nr:S1 RNA-binding domain-containing protein [Anaerolineaceae bacterium]